MTGHTVEFQGRVRSATDSLISFIHCMIDQEALVAKKISTIFIPLFKML